MPSDQIAILRALALEVKQASGASGASGESMKLKAGKGLLEILRLRRHFVELVYQTEAEKEATSKSRGALEQVR
jgi:hypothetical protein